MTTKLTGRVSEWADESATIAATVAIRRTDPILQITQYY